MPYEDHRIPLGREAPDVGFVKSMKCEQSSIAYTRGDFCSVRNFGVRRDGVEREASIGRQDMSCRARYDALLVMGSASSARYFLLPQRHQRRRLNSIPLDKPLAETLAQ